MAANLLARVLEAVDRTLAAGTALVRWRMPAGGEEFASSHGAVDFRAARLAMRSRFTLPSEAGPAHVVHNYSVVDGGALYTLQATQGEPADTWLAIEMGVEGLASTQVGMVTWLRGATEATLAGTERIAVTLDLALAVQRTGEPERQAMYAGLETGRIGLASAAVRAEVELDHAGRVRWMRSTVPPGASPLGSESFGAETMELALEDFGADVALPVPDAASRVSVAEFMAAIEITDDGFPPRPAWDADRDQLPHD